MNMFEQVEKNLEARKNMVTMVTMVTSAESLEKDGNIFENGRVTLVTEAESLEKPCISKPISEPGFPHSAEAQISQNHIKQCHKPNYADLLEKSKSGLTSSKVEDLPSAIFLFAIETVRQCPDEQFMDMGHRYCPYWRRRLDPEAWQIVKAEIRLRLGGLESKHSNPQ